MPGDDLGFRHIAEYSVDTIFRVTPEHGIMYASPSCITLLGYTPEELQGRELITLIHADHAEVVRDIALQIFTTNVEQPPVTVIRWVRKDDTAVWVETTSRVVRDPETSAPLEMILILRDSTERKALEDKLAELASTDGLTGLRNRRSFDEILDREWKTALRAGAPISLLLLDLDYFKQLNDVYGHVVGDDCLRAVALAVTACVRRGTDSVARYGGEEIAAILPHTDLEGAFQVARNICHAVAALRIPHRENKAGGGFMTASIGVATALPRDGGRMRMPESLLQSADAALYRAKHNGRNRAEAGFLLTPTAETL